MRVQTLSAAACRGDKAAHGSYVLVQKVKLYLLLERDVQIAQPAGQLLRVRRTANLEKGERGPQRFRQEPGRAPPCASAPSSPGDGLSVEQTRRPLGQVRWQHTPVELKRPRHNRCLCTLRITKSLEKRASSLAQPRQHRAKRTSTDGQRGGGEEPVESPGMAPRAGRATCKIPMQQRGGTPAGGSPAGIG